MEQKRGKDRDILDSSFARAIHQISVNLSSSGYSRRVLMDYIRVIRHFCFWQTQHAVLTEVDESAIKEFLDHLQSCTCPVSGRGSYRLCHAAMSHFFSVLQEMGLAAPACKTILPEDSILQAFQVYLTRVRGAAESSASLYTRHLRPFLQGIYTGGEFAFSALTATDIEASVARRATQCKPNTVKLYCTSLRAFFRFLRLTGEIAYPLEDAVPTIPNWNLSSIPKYLTEERVALFLASFDVKTTVGLRDHAMAQFMATAGLRAGEVANLKLNDIDWCNSRIRVNNSKSRRIDYIPLALKPGEALIAYLQKRPLTKTRNIFVSVATPTGRPLSASAVRIAMRRAFQRCFPGEPLHGAHVLRHSLATSLLAKGATYKEIADVLRHRNIDTTAIYSKVDFHNLSHATLPWPEVMI